MDDDIYEIVLRDAYFRWLCYFIGFEDVGYSSCRYCLLLTYLYSMDFYIMDDVEGNEQNRIIDATDLKVEFCETHPEIDPDTMFENDPSVLEVLVALARRIDFDIMYDSQMERNSSYWFWKIIQNLGMDGFTDDNYNYNWSYDDVDIIMERCMDRTYDKNGNGSLFPLKNPTFDPRKMEIWMQMQAWLNENYP